MEPHCELRTISRIDPFTPNVRQTMAKNVFGEDLIACSTDPMTGFFRNGQCDTCGDDHGMHTVCAVMTADFLEYSKSVGNDLSTPHEAWQFPGLQDGDHWCLCLPRWLQALEAGMAPKLVLRATHMSAIEHITMDVLLEYAVDADHAPADWHENDYDESA